jgi:group II intron reverse transcriptase/maturase
MEGRRAANEEMRSAKRSTGTGPGSSAYAPERIGQKARTSKGERFHNVISHIKAPLLMRAYLALRQDAATGVDEETWQQYGERLDERLLDLQERVQRGSYHPQPVLRVYIPKADGKQRPLGIPSLEDKIVQQAAKLLLEPILEPRFYGFSYGFRPHRSAHGALEALDAAIVRHRVNWILDADIRSFFDTIDHEQMKRFIEMHIADDGMVRLVMKMLHAGVMEDGAVKPTDAGTPQGGIISPLLANLYLHHVLDAYVHQWRTTQARGEVYIVRYADDFVVGFQHESDARTLHALLTERFAAHGLALHPDKTRVLRFGRFAHRDAGHDGAQRPQTFDFLGFTHICTKPEPKKAWYLRRTSRKKRRAKLKALGDEMRRRRHAPVAKQHKWLSSVLTGHFNYYGVPTNYRALATFRNDVRTAWHRALQRRSQRANWTSAQRTRHDERYPLPRPHIRRTSPQLSLPLAR